MVILLSVAGCTHEAKLAVDTNICGNYVLVSVDGKNVPCNVQHEGVSLAVKSGSFVISSNGTCSSLAVFVPPNGRELSREVKATYTREGARLTMHWEGAGTTTGTAETNTFTMNNEGMVFAYRK